MQDCYIVMYVRKLASECTARTKHGERALAAIADDRLPDQVSNWPQPPPAPINEPGRYSPAEQIALSQVFQTVNQAASQPSSLSNVSPEEEVSVIPAPGHSLDDSEPDSIDQLSEGAGSD